jgi:hypothetical protein
VRVGDKSEDSRSRAPWAAVAAAAILLGAACEPVPSAAVGDAGTTPVGRESHGAFFPIGAGTFHASLACGDCHTDETTFGQFTCTSCHAHDHDVAEVRHASITAYVWDSRGCRMCHPNGQEAAISVADHTAKYLPIAEGSHANLACSACHPFATTSKTFSCITGCHADDATVRQAHAAVPSYRRDSFACYGCHPKG